MPDTPKKPEQSAEDLPTEKVSDLPNKVVNDRDAESVKGGLKNAEKSIHFK